MAVSAVGRQDGRATALTVLLPLKWWGGAWLRAWFWLLRRPRRRARDFDDVDRLLFISAIRWSLLPPLVPGRWRHPRGRAPEQRPQLLFESNFDGDWDEYLDTFGVVLGRPLRWIIGAGVGYPGLEIPGMFKAYARATDTTPEHYVAAFPGLTARDLRREVLARDPCALRAIAAEGYGLTAPQWTTFLLPLARGRADAAARVARTFDQRADPPRPAVLLTTDRVHFGRVVVLRRRDRDLLLITLTHDGPVEPIVREVVEAEAARAGSASRVRALLDCVEGVPAPSFGWWDDERLVELLLAHRPRQSRHFVAYCPAPLSTVAAISAYEADPRRDLAWPAAVAGPAEAEDP